jgi:DNA-binding response OmpR family regulator
MPTSLGRILIVDDDAQGGAAIADVLGTAGYSAKVARYGRDGLRLIPLVLPDVLVLGLELPDMPGSEVLALVRREHPDLPVVIISTDRDHAVAIRLAGRTAFDYVVKPFLDGQLESSVGAAIASMSAASKARA